MEKENMLNGFEIFDELTPGGNLNKNNNDDFGMATGELTDEELEALRSQNKKGDDDDYEKKQTTSTEGDDPDNLEPDEDKTGNKKTATTKSKTKENDDVNVNVNDNEGDQDDTVKLFFESLADEMGWEMNEDDEIPSTPEELVQYFRDVIEENSTPTYANDEIAALDEFVKNGGNLRDYLKIDQEIDLDKIDIEENEQNQKMVIRALLTAKGFSDTRITKMLDKYEDAGILEDEAKDALEDLKELNEERKTQLLENQKKYAENLQKQQQQYFNDVVTTLKGMDTIHGVKIPEKDKQRLLNFIFKPDADGKTELKKKWNIKYLLETAYFVMDGEKLFRASEQNGSNKAINKFKEKLNKTSISRRTNKQDSPETDSMWDSITRVLRA